MYGPKYQWITVSTLQEHWWEPVHYKEAQNCSTQQYLEASAGYMTTSKTSLRRDRTKTVGGLVRLDKYLLMSCILALYNCANLSNVGTN